MFGYDSFISSPNSRWGMAMVRDDFKIIIFLICFQCLILEDTKYYFFQYSNVVVSFKSQINLSQNLP